MKGFDELYEKKQPALVESAEMHLLHEGLLDTITKEIVEEGDADWENVRKKILTLLPAMDQALLADRIQIARNEVGKHLIRIKLFKLSGDREAYVHAIQQEAEPIVNFLLEDEK